MQRAMLKSKIHGARVTSADLNYMGSVTIDRELIDATDLLPNERVLVVNLENGARIETYVFEGKAGSGEIGMNGGCARHCAVGDRLLIMSFAQMDDAEARAHRPRVVFTDERNRIAQVMETV
jgi:aspartate 1-decarboxylase